MKNPRYLAALTATLVISACTSAPQPPTAPSALSPGVSLQQQLAAIGWSDFARVTAAGEAVAADAPAPPTNLAVSVTGTTVTLTWSAPAGSVTAYVIEAGTASGQANIASLNTGSTATTLTVTSVPTGTFFVRVRARNADGTGAASNEVSFTIGGGPCAAPAAPTGLAATANGNTLTLQWNQVGGALSYSIEAGSSPGATNIIVFTTGNAATSFTGTAPNGTYYIRVRVNTACGTSGPSNEVAVTVGSSPPPAANPYDGTYSFGFWYIIQHGGSFSSYQSSAYGQPVSRGQFGWASRFDNSSIIYTLTGTITSLPGLCCVGTVTATVTTVNGSRTYTGTCGMPTSVPVCSARAAADVPGGDSNVLYIHKLP